MLNIPGMKGIMTSPVSRINSMAESSLSSGAHEPNKNAGGLSHPITLLPPSERDGVLAPSG
eukprot:10042343-Karenia_brevis.AAC.1